MNICNPNYTRIVALVDEDTKKRIVKFSNEYGMTITHIINKAVVRYIQDLEAKLDDTKKAN